MKVYRGLDNLPTLRNAVATMGSFDGLHSGHRELLHRVRTLAQEKGGQSVVITFDPHPRYVLGTGARMSLLSTLEEKLWLLERAEIDNVIIIPFTIELSHLSPSEFIEQQISRIGLRALVVGYNHRFGYKKEGDFDFLEQRSDLEVHLVEQHQEVGSKVSSTIIRQMLSQGRTDKAAQLLAHPYIISTTLNEEGVGAVDEHKLLPAVGRYDASIGGAKVTLTVREDHTLKVTPWGRASKVIIELE